jgi:superfamily II DNA or RNA helicase
MARHHASDPRVRSVIDRLIDLVISRGSVNAVVERLNEAREDRAQRIYPNRVHGLLTDDPSRSINTATLEVLENTLVAVEGDTDPGPKRISSDEVGRAAAAARAAGVVNEDEVVRRVASDLGLPPAVVRRLTAAAPASTNAVERSGRPAGPDWSWQDDAVKVCLDALQQRADFKAGLVVPTGGGKTRIALRVMLNWLASDTRDDTVVLWVTHRHHLKEQARRALQELSRDAEQIPEDASAIFTDRVRFTLIQSAEQELTHLGDRIGLVVVDEAHHAAAPSYAQLLTNIAAPGLFLTATPNRADNMPIGVDEIAYTITYRELFQRGCVIEPVFHPPVDMSGLDWTQPSGLTDLADLLLERTEQDFNKVLVAVTRTHGAEALYEALTDELDRRPGHPLTGDDVGFVHGSASSDGLPASAFLDEFAARPRGILVGTSQLLGEGFDDPNIDAVVTTYPSSSISHLMQVAGRALRSAPGKDSAHIIQVHESPLEYHFEQRWLYQDISDRLRPEIIDRTYASDVERTAAITQLLDDHNVHAADRTRVLSQLESLEPSDAVSVMLTGIHYYGDGNGFASRAKWGALLVTPGERERFVGIFNQVSDRSEDIREHGDFLRREVPLDPTRGSLFKAYVDLVEGMEYARRELNGDQYAGMESRPYQPRRSTTWLRYFTFAFKPDVPQELADFLHDTSNREAVIEAYLSRRSAWYGAIKVQLPLTGTLAFLLDASQNSWLHEQRQHLIATLKDSPPSRAFSEVYAWRQNLERSPIASMIVEHIDQLLRLDRFQEQYLRLQNPDFNAGR